MSIDRAVRRAVLFGTGALAIAACSGDGDSNGTASATTVTVATSITPAATSTPLTTAPSAEPDSTTASTSEPATTTAPPTAAPPTTAPPSSAPPTTARPATGPAGSTAEELVRALAADELTGRDNLTLGGMLARELISDELSAIAEPLPGLDGFEQPFSAGVNVLGMVPGTDLADEYIVVGAHYDHLTSCRNPTADDQICNGAADNATGVAAALVIARRLAEAPARRSVVIALWDAEEDGLLGAEHYVTAPGVPLDQTVAYVNFDLIGSNLLPSLSNRTLVIGAETGGPALADSLADAAAASTLDVASLSLVFGQGRSDHAPFASAGVPIAFFGDATNGCYHSVDDEADRVDFDKLDEQIEIGATLVADLASSGTPPMFDASAPVVAFADAVAIRDLVAAAEADFGVLTSFDANGLLAQLETIVAAGEAEFDDAAAGVLLGGAAALIEALAETPCR